MPPLDNPLTKSKSRNGWSPLLLKFREKYSVVLLWKTYRGDVKIYSWNKSKNSLFGNVIECTYSDGSYNFIDDLGQNASLLENLLDPSIIGGTNYLAKEIADLKSRGELARIAEMISSLGTDNDHTVHDGLQSSLLSAKVNKYRSKLGKP